MKLNPELTALYIALQDMLFNAWDEDDGISSANLYMTENIAMNVVHCESADGEETPYAISVFRGRDLMSSMKTEPLTSMDEETFLHIWTWAKNEVARLTRMDASTEPPVQYGVASTCADDTDVNIAWYPNKESAIAAMKQDIANTLSDYVIDVPANINDSDGTLTTRNTCVSWTESHAFFEKSGDWYRWSIVRGPSQHN